MITIPWEDGSGDNLYLNINQGTGNRVITITSDVNYGNDRSIDLTLTTSDGSKSVILTVNQINYARQFVGSDGLYLDINGEGLGDKIISNN